MRVFGVEGGTALIGLMVVATLSVSAIPAFAKTYPVFQPPHLSAHPLILPTPSFNAPFLSSQAGKSRFGSVGAVRLASLSFHDRSRQLSARSATAQSGRNLQCVPFARAASGIEIRGNAANWWEAAQGVYQRGSRPEYGSVLNFRPTGRMQLGHVAVVTAVLDSREIEIEHANWAGPSASKSGISRNISVIDVSPGNDWSAVRVTLGRSGGYGSVYPTFGFIYDRPDRGVGRAGNRFARSMPIAASYDEVAQVSERQAPERRSGTLDMLETSVSAGSPNRSIR